MSVTVNKNNNNYLKKAWFIYLNGIVPFLNNIFGCGVKNIQVVSGFEVELEVPSKNIFSVVGILTSLCL